MKITMNLQDFCQLFEEENDAKRRKVVEDKRKSLKVEFTPRLSLLPSHVVIACNIGYLDPFYGKLTVQIDGQTYVYMPDNLIKELAEYSVREAFDCAYYESIGDFLNQFYGDIVDLIIEEMNKQIPQMCVGFWL